MAKSRGGLNWAEEAEREEEERKAAEEAAAARIQNQSKKKSQPQNFSDAPQVRSRNFQESGILSEKSQVRVSTGSVNERRRDSLPSRADQHEGWRSRRGEKPSLEISVSFSEESAPVGRKVKIDPFGGARPREEVLAEKRSLESADSPRTVVSTDGNVSVDAEGKFADGHFERVSVETSSQTSTKLSAETSETEKRPKKANPFGEAKPREVVLAERGLDYRKMDFELEHRSICRSESEEEAKLKREIDELEHLLQTLSFKNSGKASRNAVSGDRPNRLRAQLMQKEKELQELTLFLDDKVRFSKKSERPMSRSGRSDTSMKSTSSFDQSDITGGGHLGASASHILSIENMRDYQHDYPDLRPKGRGIFQIHNAARDGTEERAYNYMDFQDSVSETHGFRPGINSGRPLSSSGYTCYSSGYSSASHGYESERPGPGSTTWSNDFDKHDFERPMTHWDADSLASDYERQGNGSRFGDQESFDSIRTGRTSACNGLSSVSASGRKTLVSNRLGTQRSAYGAESHNHFSRDNETPRRSVFDRLGPLPPMREFDGAAHTHFSNDESRTSRHSRTFSRPEKFPTDFYHEENRRGIHTDRVQGNSRNYEGIFKRAEENELQEGNKRGSRGKRGGHKKTNGISRHTFHQDRW
eukprot:TRINITY_DN13204_c0_g1_i1.p1 TRINITY_DN13204_c0_g1~~TRINITY_DN13204_c0_g1_i1.p1  ORF type:complete len:644 (+),score=135.45 TRINITY_DN13204_c0_g1_i1:209-2140(+)